MAEKINNKMDIEEMVLVMSEGNPGAVMVLVDMLSDFTGMLDILMLDSMDIRGSRLYKLNNDCCGRDLKKFRRTLMMMRDGVFTQEQIYSNLDRCYALPFIDDSIKIEGVPPYGEDFGPIHPVWNEWCKAQEVSFKQRCCSSNG